MKRYDIQKMMNLVRKAEASMATAEDRDKAIATVHNYIILGYTLMNAADIIMRETARILSRVGPERKYLDPLHISESLKDVERVIRRNDVYIQTLDGILAENNPEGYDRVRNNAYEILRFVMLLYSRTCGDMAATEKLGVFMSEMKSNGIFSDEEIAKFKMK